LFFKKQYLYTVIFQLITNITTMKKINRILLVIACFAAFSNSTKSQVVDDTFTPAQLVQQVFLGQGVNVFNITFQGDSLQQLGKFTGFGSTGIDSGIVISTGRALDIAQPGGAAGTEFVLTEFSATRAVFDNPRHDYPKRIVYELSAEGGLTATIGFLKGGTPRRFEFKRER
jgi:hypothetical protein